MCCLGRCFFHRSTGWVACARLSVSTDERKKRANNEKVGGRAKNGRGREGESLEQATGCVKGELYSKFYAHFGEQKKKQKTNKVLIK